MDMEQAQHGNRHVGSKGRALNEHVVWCSDALVLITHGALMLWCSSLRCKFLLGEYAYLKRACVGVFYIKVRVDSRAVMILCCIAIDAHDLMMMI